MKHTLALSALALATSALMGCSSNSPASTTTSFSAVESYNIQCTTRIEPQPSEMSVSGLTLVGTSIADAPFGTSAAEIVSYDTCTDKLYVVNAQGKKVDVLSLSESGEPSAQGQIDLTSAATQSGVAIGAANSVSVHQGLVAVAIENENKQEPGIIALYRSDSLELITTYPAGALPDMVSFSKDGQYIAAANEGEPNADYSIDPEGSVTLIDLKSGPLDAVVTQIDFREFNEATPVMVNCLRTSYFSSERNRRARPGA